MEDDPQKKNKEGSNKRISSYDYDAWSKFDVVIFIISFHTCEGGSALSVKSNFIEAIVSSGFSTCLFLTFTGDLRK